MNEMKSDKMDDGPSELALVDVINKTAVSPLQPGGCLSKNPLLICCRWNGYLLDSCVSTAKLFPFLLIVGILSFDTFVNIFNTHGSELQFGKY